MIYQADRLFLLMWFIAHSHRCNERKGLSIHFKMEKYYQEKELLLNDLRTIGIAQGTASYQGLEIKYHKQMSRRNINPVDLDKLGIVRIG